MGEHCDDLPYEEIIQRREAEREEEEKQRARREAEELAKQEILLAGIIGISPWFTYIYCTASFTFSYSL